MLNKIIEITGISEYNILYCYVYGSYVYKNNLNSDIDILLVVDDDYLIEESHINKGIYDIHIINCGEFYKELEEYRIVTLECIFSPYKIKEVKHISINIDKQKLRRSVSATCSNSWVKAKKKINQGDYYIGLKSLFHSMRIAMFAIQLKEQGNIIDWQCANKIYYDLVSKEWIFEELQEKYKPVINKLMSEFRKDIILDK